MRKASLSEILGKAGAGAASSRKLSFDDLPDLLGESMPEIHFDAVGRHRLVMSLQKRFGPDYKNIKGVSDIITDFDSRRDFQGTLSKLKAIRYEHPKKKETK